LRFCFHLIDWRLGWLRGTVWKSNETVFRPSRGDAPRALRVISPGGHKRCLLTGHPGSSRLHRHPLRNDWHENDVPCRRVTRNFTESIRAFPGLREHDSSSRLLVTRTGPGHTLRSSIWHTAPGLPFRPHWNLEELMIRTHTVVEGDTLSAIAQSFYGDASRFWVIAAGKRDHRSRRDQCRPSAGHP
jgi:hypothetical protein